VLLFDDPGASAYLPLHGTSSNAEADGRGRAPKLSTDLRGPTSTRCEQQTPALMAPDEIETRRGGGAGSQAGAFADPAG
jgi:hypothetical protein